MDSNSYYNLQILKQLEEVPHLTHRLAAEKLGVSVKLAHSVFKGLIQRGLVHTSRRDGRSLNYLLTHAGISEKIRLTYEFVNFTTQFFREARQRSSEVCRRLARQGTRKVAFLGCGELAEISYLGVKEHGLKLITIFDEQQAGEMFLDSVIKPLKDLNRERSSEARDYFEKILVTTYDPDFPARAHYIPPGVEIDERFIWVFDYEDMIKDSAQENIVDDSEAGRDS